VHPYSTLEYARTLEHVGEPHFVPDWGTYVIARPVEAFHRDVAGPYPLAMLKPDADVRGGIEQLREEGFISAVLVCDHLSGPAMRVLTNAFARAEPFKQHYVVDRSIQPWLPSNHHQDEIRRATRRGIVVEWTALSDVLDDWVSLYAELKSRRGVSGTADFSRSSFERLAQCSGLRTAVAYLNGDVVGSHLWFSHEGRMWSHLASTNELGRRNGAAYALYDFSIRESGASLVSLGGAAGTVESEDDGLARFKRGFANSSILTNLYGAILDANRYDELCDERRAGESTFFPSYRTPLVPARSA
jgi:hypothetical protein